jgi:hypothetical protein
MQRNIGLAVLGLAAVLVGCSGNSTNGSGIFNQPAPRLRAINAIDGVATADWVDSSQNNLTFPPIAYGAVTGSATSPYTILNEQGTQQTVNFYSSNAPTIAVASATITPYYTNKNTIVAYGSESAGKTITLFDLTTTQSAPTVRIVDASTLEGNLDLFITPVGLSQGTTPISIGPGSVYPAQSTGTYTYAALPSGGSYLVTAYHAGQDASAPVYNYTFTVTGGPVYTLVLIDSAYAGAAPAVLAIEDDNPNAG